MKRVYKISEPYIKQEDFNSDLQNKNNDDSNLLEYLNSSDLKKYSANKCTFTASNSVSCFSSTLRINSENKDKYTKQPYIKTCDARMNEIITPTKDGHMNNQSGHNNEASVNILITEDCELISPSCNTASFFASAFHAERQDNFSRIIQSEIEISDSDSIETSIILTSTPNKDGEIEYTTIINTSESSDIILLDDSILSNSSTQPIYVNSLNTSPNLQHTNDTSKDVSVIRLIREDCELISPITENDNEITSTIFKHDNGVVSPIICIEDPVRHNDDDLISPIEIFPKDELKKLTFTPKIILVNIEIHNQSNE